MKVSLNLAQFYSNVDLKSIPTTELVRRVGAQLGAVEEVVEWAPHYEGVFVAKVISCIKHPNADKLSVCRVDDGGVVKDVERGDDGFVQVVCGAPNVRDGMFVAWLPPGAVVPSTRDKDPLTLEAREIRGQVSNGMLASAHELGISDEHNGILQIDQADVGPELTKPGTPFSQLYGLDDVVIDCENKMFTHRPDCFGNLGVARELAGINGLKFISPDWYTKVPSFEAISGLPLDARVDATDLVPRFMAIAMNDITVGPSPVWMQAGLARVGIRPINNVVDITNFIMHLTGQPLHAYDYDRVKAKSGGTATLVARKAVKNEKLALLSGKTVTLDETVVVIATDKEAIGIAGVMGGSDTEVDADTKNIILECATFDMYNIRRTSMKYGLFTDAVSRFSKGQSPLQNDRIIAYAASQISELAGGKVASSVKDIKSFGEKVFSSKSIHEPVVVPVDFINKRLGLSLEAQEIKKFLENVEIDVEVSESDLKVTAPFWRTDIELPEDVVEEVGRLHGFSDIPVELPKRSIRPASNDPLLKLKDTVRSVLARAGANEVLTYSFVHGNLLDKVGQEKAHAFQLSNALSPDLQYFRMSITPSILDKVYANIRSGHEELALFEMGKTHNKNHATDPENDDEKVPKEFNSIGFVVSASSKMAKKHQGSAFYQARAYVDFLASQFGLQVEYVAIAEVLPHPVTGPFDQTRSAMIKDVKSDRILGIIGEFRTVVQKALKLPAFTAGFELGLDELLESASTTNSYTALSKFPGIAADMTFRTLSSVSYQKLVSCIQQQIELATKDKGYIYKISPVGVYQPSEQASSRNITLHIELSHPTRTLKTEEANALLDAVSGAVQASTTAERI